MTAVTVPAIVAPFLPTPPLQRHPPTYHTPLPAVGYYLSLPWTDGTVTTYLYHTYTTSPTWDTFYYSRFAGRFTLSWRPYKRQPYPLPRAHGMVGRLFSY